MAALKENSKNIFYYVQAHESENITAQDIADALGPDSTCTGFCSGNGRFCRTGF